jgi:hypothetical protein
MENEKDGGGVADDQDDEWLKDVPRISRALQAMFLRWFRSNPRHVVDEHVQETYSRFVAQWRKEPVSDPESYIWRIALRLKSELQAKYAQEQEAFDFNYEIGKSENIVHPDDADPGPRPHPDRLDELGAQLPDYLKPAFELIRQGLKNAAIDWKLEYKPDTARIYRARILRHLRALVKKEQRRGNE